MGIRGRGVNAESARANGLGVAHHVSGVIFHRMRAVATHGKSSAVVLPAPAVNAVLGTCHATAVIAGRERNPDIRAIPPAVAYRTVQSRSRGRGDSILARGNDVRPAAIQPVPPRPHPVVVRLTVGQTIESVTGIPDPQTGEHPASETGVP